ncbi:hypothetical protein IWX90DRAFT_510218 [Phyllosticta citrichinensis]|uniref:DUF6604 domain-containing protein n=1 Tax=Phyllosticta citrichinensis TaxID=1130410 RepID=A0ABR1Y6U8_9PEZI
MPTFQGISDTILIISIIVLVLFGGAFVMASGYRLFRNFALANMVPADEEEWVELQGVFWTALDVMQVPPSLCDFLKSSYQQYKEDTNTVASWLAITARSYGYPQDLLQNQNINNAPTS